MLHLVLQPWQKPRRLLYTPRGAPVRAVHFTTENISSSSVSRMLMSVIQFPGVWRVPNAVCGRGRVGKSVAAHHCRPSGGADADPSDRRAAGVLARVLVYGNLLPHSHVSPRTHRSAFSVLLNHTRPTPRSPHRISETYSAAAMADEMTCLVRDCTNVGIYAIRGNECQEITSQVGRRPLDRADASIEFDKIADSKKAGRLSLRDTVLRTLILPGAYCPPN